jgi:hypothetical protein
MEELGLEGEAVESRDPAGQEGRSTVCLVLFRVSWLLTASLFLLNFQDIKMSFTLTPPPISTDGAGTGATQDWEEENPRQTHSKPARFILHVRKP